MLPEEIFLQSECFGDVDDRGRQEMRQPLFEITQEHLVNRRLGTDGATGAFEHALEALLWHLYNTL